MDTDDATIGRIFSRRAALAAMARAGFGAVIGSAMARSAWAATTPSTRPATRPAILVAAPALTEGPFFVEERLNRSNLIGGSTRPSVALGTPLDLSIAVHLLVNDKAVPLQGAHVELWHCDAIGIYSDESDPMNNEVTRGQRWLRGYQLAGDDGRVRFQTIVPGWYNGRAPHIHFKVRREGTIVAGVATRPVTNDVVAANNSGPFNRRSATAEFTSQFFFRDKQLATVYAGKPYRGSDGIDTANIHDGVYRERLADGSMAGQHLTLNMEPAGAGRSADFTILLTDTSLRGQRQFGRGRPPRRRPEDDIFDWQG